MSFRAGRAWVKPELAPCDKILDETAKLSAVDVKTVQKHIKRRKFTDVYAIYLLLLRKQQRERGGSVSVERSVERETGFGKSDHDVVSHETGSGIKQNEQVSKAAVPSRREDVQVVNLVDDDDDLEVREEIQPELPTMEEITKLRTSRQVELEDHHSGMNLQRQHLRREALGLRDQALVEARQREADYRQKLLEMSKKAVLEMSKHRTILDDDRALDADGCEVDDTHVRDMDDSRAAFEQLDRSDIGLEQESVGESVAEEEDITKLYDESNVSFSEMSADRSREEIRCLDISALSERYERHTIEKDDKQDRMLDEGDVRRSQSPLVKLFSCSQNSTQHKQNVNANVSVDVEDVVISRPHIRTVPTPTRSPAKPLRNFSPRNVTTAPTTKATAANNMFRLSPRNASPTKHTSPIKPTKLTVPSAVRTRSRIPAPILRSPR